MNVIWEAVGTVALIAAGVGLFFAAVNVWAATLVTSLPFRPRYLRRRNREQEWLRLAAMVERGELGPHDACIEYQRVVGCLYLRDGTEEIDAIYDAANRRLNHGRRFA